MTTNEKRPTAVAGRRALKLNRVQVGGLSIMAPPRGPSCG
jgi:hypothetical protein